MCFVFYILELILWKQTLEKQQQKQIGVRLYKQQQKWVLCKHGQSRMRRWLGGHYKLHEYNESESASQFVKSELHK